MRCPSPLCVLLLSMAHFILGCAVFLWSYQVSSAAFDGKAVSWLGRHAARHAVEVLWFPALPIVEVLRANGLRLPALLQWVPIVINSVLWALVLCALGSMHTRASQVRRGREDP